MIPRAYDKLHTYLKKNRVLIIYGARRVGKTTLIEQFLKTTPLKYRLDTGDNLRIQELFGSLDFDRLLEYAQGYELIILDEAQEIPQIGKALKILADQVQGLHIIVTGSSSFNLAQSVGEPLTGRKKTLTLYPVAQSELRTFYTPYELKERLENSLLFGHYPEVLLAENREEKIDLILEMVDSYLLKDILAHEKVKSPKMLLDLLKLLAYQIGQMVSLHELATQLHIDVKTVGRYLDLLEKAFVIYKLGGFSRNLRKEVTSKCKYYFYDIGMRNGVIRHFNPLNLRNDAGQLWENFFLIERLKSTSYCGFYGNRYFWRTYQGQEIDLVETQDHELAAYECKWSSKKAKPSPPKEWAKAYPTASYETITPENYLSHL